MQEEGVHTDEAALSQSLDRAFPSFDLARAQAQCRADEVCLERLCRDLQDRLHPNPYRLAYEDPFVASSVADLVWCDRESAIDSDNEKQFDYYCEVILPIRQPIANATESSALLKQKRKQQQKQQQQEDQLHFAIVDPGIVTVRIHAESSGDQKKPAKLHRKKPDHDKRQKVKADAKRRGKNSQVKVEAKEKKEPKKKKGGGANGMKDPLDQLKSSTTDGDGQFLSPARALKATARVVRLAMQQLQADFSDLMTLHSVRLDKHCGAVRVCVEIRPEYLIDEVTKPQGDEEIDREVCKLEATSRRQKPVAFSFPVEAQTDGGAEATNCDREPTTPDLPFNEPRLMKLCVTPALRLPPTERCNTADLDDGETEHNEPVGGAFAVPPSSTRDAAVNFRCACRRDAGCGSDEDVDLAVACSCWTLRHPAKEAAVLAALARADRGLRLRVCRGITELCQREPSGALACLVDRRPVLHCLMELAEAELAQDAGGDRCQPWQLANCGQITRSLLRRLSDRLADGRLPNYFDAQLNLLAINNAAALDDRDRGPWSRRAYLTASAKLEFYLRRPEALLRAALPAQWSPRSVSTADSVSIQSDYC